MNDRALSIEGIVKRFDRVEAIGGLSLDIARRELVVIVGPSGCGKTTLLNLLAGHLEPTSGVVHRQGQARMIYQDGGLLPWLTAAENIRLGLRKIGDTGQREAELHRLLAFIGLEEFAGHYPWQLSGGMSQRVELARALAGDTDILLMDEPFSSLDYFGRLRMRQDFVRILAGRPCTVVLVTHDVHEAAQLADRVVVLSERPARLRFELSINLPRPRSLTHPVVVDTVHRILETMGLDEHGDSLPDLATTDLTS